MPAVLRYGLMVGLGVVVVDWLTELAVRALPPDDPILAAIGMANWVLNTALFAYGGYLGFRSDGIIRSGAEVGVIAGLIAAAVAALRLSISPLPDSGPIDATDVIGLLALNVALGGVSALFGALVARRRSQGTHPPQQR